VRPAGDAGELRRCAGGVLRHSVAKGDALSVRILLRSGAGVKIGLRRQPHKDTALVESNGAREGDGFRAAARVKAKSSREPLLNKKRKESGESHSTKERKQVQ
jgi:hypothetical protein